MSRIFRSAPPRASAMLESLRGLGYSPETALADTIDNSISAGADTVQVLLRWDGANSYVAIIDNGQGISPTELEAAMRLGGRDPQEYRKSGDLGRFGLGLKTAAFSQCRRLTVLSRDSLQVDACFCWDLDVLARQEDDDWRLLVGADEGSLARLEALPRQNPGTLVLWENMDRLIPSGSDQQDFLDVIDRAERHLSMVFHRYLERSRSNLKILINGKAIAPWNPFAAGSQNPSWSSPLERLQGRNGECQVQCFVLPHRDRLSKSEYEWAAGINGWSAQQGFYVYRNDRLLVPGSWLGLGSPRLWTKDEVHRLARISLNFPTSGDADWKIDIRKSIARPPVTLRPRLIALAEVTRKRARAVFANKGNVQRRPSEGPILEVWQSVVTGGTTRYRVNRDHPVVRAVLDSTVGVDDAVDNMLSVLESTIPVQRIWLDAVEERNSPPIVSEVQAELIRPMLGKLYRALLERQYSTEDAKQKLLRTEPFQGYPDLIAQLSALDLEDESSNANS